jgi:hypothetical protein
MQRFRMIGIISEDFATAFFGFGKPPRLQVSQPEFEEGRGRSV